MPRHVLHIGTHKTGSTTIQTFLAENRLALLEQGIDFPLLGREEISPKAHAELPRYFLGKTRDASAIEAVRRLDAPTVIISAETLYQCSAVSTLDRIAASFPRDSSVVCYFRDPVEHVLSMYKQAMKTRGAAHSLKEFVKLHTDAMKGSEAFAYYRYEQNISEWYKRFSNVTVRMYVRMPSAELIRRFFRDCAINLELQGLTFPADRNESPSDEVSILLLRVNELQKTGKIDAATREAWTQRFLQRNQGVEERLRGKIDWQPVAFEEFLAGYEQHSNAFNRTDGRRAKLDSQVSFPAGLKMTDQEVIELMKELVGRDADQGPKPWVGALPPGNE